MNEEVEGVGWTDEDEATRARLFAHGKRLLTASLSSGQRAGARRMAAARLFAKHHFYPTNADGLNDQTLDEFVRFALQCGSLDPESHYLLFPEMGGVHLIQRNEQHSYSLLGQDVFDERVRYVGPCADLDSVVRVVWRDLLTCYYCLSATASGLLPLPCPPHIVVVSLCLECTERLAVRFPRLHFVFPTTQGETHG